MKKEIKLEMNNCYKKVIELLEGKCDCKHPVSTYFKSDGKIFVDGRQVIYLEDAPKYCQIEWGDKVDRIVLKKEERELMYKESKNFRLL